MWPSILSAWRAWNQPNEGWTNFAYTDIRNLVTVGMGNLIDPVSLALPLPWTEPDGSPTTNVEEQWEAVKNGGVNSSTGAGHLTTMRLSDAAIMGLVEQTIAQNEEVLRGYFPGWDSLPADAQAAIMSMAWAMGPGFPATFTNFAAAVNRGDWAGAAASHAYHGPGTENRQAQELLALSNAAAVAEQGLDPATLYWPGVAGGSSRGGLLAGGLVLAVGGALALSPTLREHALTWGRAAWSWAKELPL